MSSLNIVKDAIYLGYFIYLFYNLNDGIYGDCLASDGNMVPLFVGLKNDSDFFGG